MTTVHGPEETTGSFTLSPWREWTKRLQAYNEWLNIQLKTHPSNRKITDIRYDLQDGVVIAQLIEALGGEPVAGVDLNPSSPISRKENVERVFQHLSMKQVPISNCKTKDVLAGELKCIMRLVHAVASHYRPESVLHPPSVATTTSSSSSSKSPSSSHLTDVGHTRCATSLNYGINKEGSKSTTSIGRPRSQTPAPVKKAIGGSSLPIRKQPLPIRDTPKLKSTLSNLSLDNKRCPLRKSFTSLTGERLSKGNANTIIVNSSSNTSSVKETAATKISCKVAPLQYSRGTAGVPELHSISFPKLSKDKLLVSRSEPCSLDSVDVKTADEPAPVKKERTCSCSTLSDDIIERLLKDIQDAKSQLLLLQEILLHGNGGKFMKNLESGLPYGSTEEPENAVASNQVLHDAVPKDVMNSKRNKISEPLSMVCGEKKAADESPKTKLTGHGPTPFDDVLARNTKEEENEFLRKTIEEKDLEIRRLKLALTNQMAGYDKKVKYPYTLVTQTQREELQVVHEALTSLRRCFPANDPYQHTLDTIEQSLSALLERVNSLEIGATAQPNQSPPPTVTETVPGLARRANYEALNEKRRPFPRTSGFSVQKQEDTRDSTKVVYYMDKSVTPFRCVLNKRIGEATLRDFKLLFDRPGQYRYHFKTLDPEFGMVKEEVLHDEDILPGWDGKIIAWIEDDCS